MLIHEDSIWQKNEPIPTKKGAESTSKELILSSIYSPNAKISPKERIPVTRLKLNKLTKVSYSISCQTASLSNFGIKDIAHLENLEVIAFDSPKVLLCRALFIIAMNTEEYDNFNRDNMRSQVGIFLDSILPLIEAVYRRQIDRISRKINSSSEGLYTGRPGFYFQNTFRDICKSLHVEGASLIVKGLPRSQSLLQLVSSYPKSLPNDRNIYPDESNSPTQWIFSFAKSCTIPSINLLRNLLAKECKDDIKDFPIWCDIECFDFDRSIVYAFYISQEDIQYLFRCTNSLKNPSKHFHVLDRKICQELVVTFGLMHKSIENDFRAMRIFFDVKHEFRQKLIGVNSAANYVLKSLKRNLNNDIIHHERIMKLGHIKNTVLEIVKMLSRFNFPFPTVDDKDNKALPFKPFGDLVKPICETFFDKARNNGKYFTFHGKDQLGLMYSSLSDWKQVIENIVNNMVKYTLDNEEIAVAFQRKNEGGGLIHFASKSTEILPEEIEMLFEFKYRSKAAVQKTSDGDGIGLSIAKYIVASYGAQILVRIQNDVNIFSISLPKHLFRP